MSVSLLLLFSLVEWQCDDLRCQASPTYIDLHGLSDNSICCLNVAHTDILVQYGTRRTAGKHANVSFTLIYKVATTRHAPVDHLDADELTFETLFFGLQQCVTADEIPFLQFYCPAKTGFQWVGLLIEFMAIEAITRFQAQRVARP